MNILPWNHSNNDVDINRNENHFANFQREMNRLFDSFFNDSSFLPATFGSQSRGASPAVEVVENDKAFKVSVELPAMDAEDVELSINDHYLTISGEKKEEKEERGEDDTVVRSERYYGSYKRTLPLPETANADKAQATFKKGVLHIEIPKKAEAQAKTRKVEIKQAA